jgi:hypothetical protein
MRFSSLNFDFAKFLLGAALVGWRLAPTLSIVCMLVSENGLAHDLRTLPIAQLRASNTCTSTTPAGPFVPVGEGYKHKYNTIAHRFLDDEIGAGDVTQEMYAILDMLIDESVAILKPYPSGLSILQAQKFAIDSLKAIDCILLRHGFVYPGHGLVQLLSDGLGPTYYNVTSDLDDLRNQRHNVRRAAFINARGAGPYYVVDCDIASFIFLGIAEVMKYPLHLIEIPQHNFVRWEFSPGSYVNFETMDGFETDDDYYKTNWFIPDAFVGRGGILDTMNDKQTVAYHDASVALSWSWRGDLTRMIDFYLRSISADSTHAFALNNLAWFYAAVPKTELRNGEKSIQYGLQAVAVIADGDKLDTLACGYAQNGDFAKAIETEGDAIKAAYTPFGSNLAGDLALFRDIPPRTCNDSGFGKDPAPFRPGQGVARAATDKELLRLH